MAKQQPTTTTSYGTILSTTTTTPDRSNTANTTTNGDNIASVEHGNGSIDNNDDAKRGGNNNNNSTGTERRSLLGGSLPVVESLQSIAHSKFALSGEDCSHHHHYITTGTATIASEVANMTKNLIGGGVLSLSGGISLFSDDPSTATVYAVAWVIALGTVFGYFCLLIGKSCRISRSQTYRECWERTVGTKGGLLVAVANTLDPLLGILANASILAQSLQLLLQGMLNVRWSAVTCLLLVTLVGILPLCLMKNLDALAPFSALGMAAVLTVLGVMVARFVDGSYLPGGYYREDVPPPLRPNFGARNRPWSADILPFLCMVYTSFDMHYNSPRFYAELSNATIPRFARTVAFSFGLTAAVYFSIAVVGFWTFGANSDSYILNNYSSKDPLATVARLAMGLSALVSYPLNFIGVRDNCLDILGITDQVDTPGKLNVVTLILLSVLTLTSCFVTDLGLINSVGGGTTVTLVCFVFPALMFQHGILKQQQQRQRQQRGGTAHQQQQQQQRRSRIGQWCELWLVMILMIVGTVLGIIGVWYSILEA